MVGSNEEEDGGVGGVEDCDGEYDGDGDCPPK